MRIAIALLLLCVTQLAAADKVDDYVRKEMAKQRIPGLTLAIVRDGKIVKSAGYGLADLDNDVKVKPETVFETASITKQFTATLVMMLAQEGKLRVDDKINAYLPNPPDKWKDITIRHLLNHTSGFPTMQNGFKGISRMRTSTTEEMYADVKSSEVVGTPGEKHAYSDVGYFLLGMIIEKVTGKKYSEALSDRILKPLQMDSSRVQDHLLPYKNLAKGYTLYTGPEVKGVPTLVNIRRIADRGLTSHYGLYSTVLDLAKWDAALYTDRLINESSKSQMWSFTKFADGSTWNYGFGWYVGERAGQRYTFHGGITGTGIIRFPGLKLSVIVLTNLGWWGDGTGQGASPEKIVKELAALVDPRLYLNAMPDPAPATSAKARIVFEALAKGNVIKESFTKEGAEIMAKYMADSLAAIKPLGDIRKFELLEITQKGREAEIRLYRVTGSKATGQFAFDFDPSGLIMDVYPQG